MNRILFILMLLMGVPAQAQMIIERGAIRSDPTEAQRGQGTHREENGIIRCGRETKAPPECGVDLNGAPPELLLRVPGITQYDVNRIISGRPYARTSELQERGIISTLLWDETRNFFYVLRVSINHSTRAEIRERLGLDDIQTQRIIAGRPWSNLDDLTFAGILTHQRMEILRPLLSLR